MIELRIESASISEPAQQRSCGAFLSGGAHHLNFLISYLLCTVMAVGSILASFFMSDLNYLCAHTSSSVLL
jgi:hypothetical protein